MFFFFKASLFLESNLTQWVYSRKTELETEGIAPAKKEAPKRDNRIFNRALDAIGNGRKREHETRSRSRSRSRSPVRKEARYSHREENVFSRLGQSKEEGKKKKARIDE
jgi:hypothetical protein